MFFGKFWREICSQKPSKKLPLKESVIPDCRIAADKRGEASTAFTFASNGNIISIDEDLCLWLKRTPDELTGSQLSSIMTRYSVEMMLLSRKASKLGRIQNLNVTFITGNREIMPAKINIVVNIANGEPCFNCKTSFKKNTSCSNEEDSKTEKMAELAAFATAVVDESGPSIYDLYESAPIIDMRIVLRDCIKFVGYLCNGSILINLIEDENPLNVRAHLEYLKNLFISALLTAHAAIKENSGEISVVAGRNISNSSIRIEIEAYALKVLNSRYSGHISPSSAAFP